MATSLNINDALLQEALALDDQTTVDDLVETALREYIQRHQWLKVLTLFGSIDYDRQAAGSHEIWYNPDTDHYTTIPNHSGDMPEGILRAILKQADILPDDFWIGD